MPEAIDSENISDPKSTFDHLSSLHNLSDIMQTHEIMPDNLFGKIDKRAVELAKPAIKPVIPPKKS